MVQGRAEDVGSTAGLPGELVRLLEAVGEAAREEAWQAFVHRFSRLILYAARSESRDYDGTMNRYAYVLEGLRQDDFRRLQAYTANGRGRFATWLVVVARRLCTDYHRKRYGRLQHDGSPEDRSAAERRWATRRRLVDLMGEEIDPRLTPDPRSHNPELALRQRELRESLSEALDDLSSRDRLLLQLRFEEQMSAREIAESMTYSSQFQVYRRLRSLLSRLRGDLRRRGVHDPRP